MSSTCSYPSPPQPTHSTRHLTCLENSVAYTAVVTSHPKFSAGTLLAAVYRRQSLNKLLPRDSHLLVFCRFISMIIGLLVLVPSSSCRQHYYLFPGANMKV